MISESKRAAVYREVEAIFPMKPTGWRAAGNEAPVLRQISPSPGSMPSDLGIQLRQHLEALKGDVVTQVLYLLQTLFIFPAEGEVLQNSTRRAVERLYEAEDGCRRGAGFQGHMQAYSRIRQDWEKDFCDGPLAGLGASVPLLTGFRHLEGVGFFRKQPLEIASWTSIFLEIERYHRSDPAEHERRIDRLKLLEGRKEPHNVKTLEDLHILLERALLAEMAKPAADVSELSARLARELEERLAPEIVLGSPLQAFLYVLLRSHELCMAETWEEEDLFRLDRLHSTREFDSLIDLMRVVVQRTLREERLPLVIDLLDQLQKEGFNIKHEKFRDPYESTCVPLGDTERLERCRLPLFVNVEELSGDFQLDLSLGNEILLRQHKRIVEDVAQELKAYAVASSQPLPQARLLRRLVQLATSWFLALHPWPIEKPVSQWDEQIRSLLPDGVIKQLVRPRKGYEVPSRQELKGMIEEEGAKQWEALRLIGSTGMIQGWVDYGIFARYGILRAIGKQCGVKLQELQVEDCLASIDKQGMAKPQWLMDLASELSIRVMGGWAHTLESIREYFAQRIALVLSEVEDAQAAAEIRGRLTEEMVSTSYRLAVALGRHQSNLPRMEITLSPDESIAAFVRFLAPSLERMERVARDTTGRAFSAGKNVLYRSQCRPFVTNSEEWRVLVAWLVHQRTGHDLSAFLENAHLDGFLAEIARDVETAECVPGLLPFRTVRSTLLDLLGRGVASSEEEIELTEEVLALLPGLDCGACGESACRGFARSLLKGNREPGRCVHLPAQEVSRLLQVLRGKVSRSNGNKGRANPLEIFQDPSNWHRSGFRGLFEAVFCPVKRKARRLFLERLGEVWNRLSPKPEIFKCPDSESFYRELCRYVGYESAERLTDDERRMLVEHGDAREDAEWRALKERQDWLNIAVANRQGRPFLLKRDPEAAALQFYDGKFFLHQLSPRDRSLVLLSRLERCEDGFRHWWNEDLLTLKDPQFTIHDWEDFTKIIKNAYWHQENSLAPQDLLRSLQIPRIGPGAEGGLPAILRALPSGFMERLVEDEACQLERRRTAVRALRAGEALSCLSDLRMLLEGLAEETLGEEGVFRGNVQLPEDQVSLVRRAVWHRFQAENISFSRGFRCRWEDLSPFEQDALAKEMGHGSAPPRQRGHDLFFLEEWGGPIGKQAALVRALIAGIVRRKVGEIAEANWFNELLKGNSQARPPIGSFRLFIRRLLESGASTEEVKREIAQVLDSLKGKEELLRGLQDDLLHMSISRRAHEVLRESRGDGGGELDDTVMDSILERQPDLKIAMDRALYSQPRIDRERLLRYLYLLAKMEGNLDTLTALLREIRETSDIIEAAWLRFTEERVLEGPPAKAPPDGWMGIPILVSSLPDKEAVNLCLRNGVSRGEKRNVAAAANELLNFIRFHLLLRAKEGNLVDPGEVVQDLIAAGYDLRDIQEDSLLAAARREAGRLGQLRCRRIWISTMATARRLAAKHPELNEIERQFQKLRLEILKGDGSADDRRVEIVSRRGVLLGQIKEEMYRVLSDLLEGERVATFQNRIRQIVDQLDDKREEIFAGWSRGEINRRTVFYILRQYQKRGADPTWEDFLQFLVEHWMKPVAEARASGRIDGEERIRERDEKMRALLGISLLDLEEDALKEAQAHFQGWVQDQVAAIGAQCI
ncbi:MAG: hypothetical protein GX443_04430 [Deltaproteobacteria bacterium]|nr:hypothetical protein [Deltaproteobacteria bacterium]